VGRPERPPLRLVRLHVGCVFPLTDRPQTLRAVRSWFAEAGLVDVQVPPGYNGIQGRGRLPR
jgi:hypothetical protein